MRKWKYFVDFKHFWNNDSMSIEDKGKAAAQALKKAFPKDWLNEDSYSYNEDLANIVDNFEEFGNDWGLTAVQMFDDNMSYLYDMGDTNLGNGQKLAWINTYV